MPLQQYQCLQGGGSLPSKTPPCITASFKPFKLKYMWWPREGAVKISIQQSTPACLKQDFCYSFLTSGNSEISKSLYSRQVTPIALGNIWSICRVHKCSYWPSLSHIQQNLYRHQHQMVGSIIGPNNGNVHESPLQKFTVIKTTLLCSDLHTTFPDILSSYHKSTLDQSIFRSSRDQAAKKLFT